jgi:hypothetical protein
MRCNVWRYSTTTLRVAPGVVVVVCAGGVPLVDPKWPSPNQQANPVTGRIHRDGSLLGLLALSSIDPGYVWPDHG